MCIELEAKIIVPKDEGGNHYLRMYSEDGEFITRLYLNTKAKKPYETYLKNFYIGEFE